MKYKMKYYGSAEGRVTRLTLHFDKDQIIEAPEGEFDEVTADQITEERKEVEVTEGKKAETASFKHKRR